VTSSGLCACLVRRNLDEGGSLVRRCKRVVKNLLENGMPSVYSVSISNRGMRYLVVMLLLLGSGPAFANTITQYTCQYNTGTGKAVLDLELLNNDNGAVYDSYDLTICSNLATRLWQQPRNQILYSNKTEMVADWNATIRDPPTGEVEDGWSHDGNYDDLEFTHIPRIPNLSYDQWDATSQNPGQDMMFLTLGIPLTQLDGNGDGWRADDPSDWEIVPGNESANVGIGHEGPFSWNASVRPYSIMKLSAVSNRIAGAVEIYYTGVSNQWYQAQYSTNMAGSNWVNLGEAVLGTGGTNSVFDSTREAGEKFYRVIKVPLENGAG